MPYIPMEEIGKHAHCCIILHGAFETVASVSEDWLMSNLGDASFADWFGDAIDPYRTIRGPGIGRPNIF